MFGFPIQMTFNGTSNHQTCLGGLFSVWINLILVWFCFLKIRLMWKYQNDSVATNSDHMDFEAYGNVSFADSEFLPYVAFKDSQASPPTNMDFTDDEY
jgi:hypothetical protein